MSGRLRAVALQALGVAVIAGIIFVAFLRPDEPDGLSGIEAEGQEQIGIDPKPVDEPRKNRRKNGDKTDGKQGQSGMSELRDIGQVNESRGADGSAGNDVQFDDGDDTPPVDQYDDLVDRLMERVGEPELYREIDQAP